MRGIAQESDAQLFRRACFATLLGLLLGAHAEADAPSERSLSFYHTHTLRELDVVYWRDGAYVETALQKIEGFLSDFRTGDAHVIDPDLLDLLHAVYRRAGSKGRFEVISAYRSPQTNAMLRARSSGVAKRSQHVLGKAIDVRLTDVPTIELRRIALELARGGVGYYEKSNFVHLDTGRVRAW